MKIRKLFPTNNQLLEKNNEATLPITNKLPDNWDDLFKNYCDLPPKEFQLRIRKQCKTPTDCSEGDHKVNNKSPTDCSEVESKVNNNSSTDQTEGDRKVNKNSPTDQTEGDRKVNKNSPTDQAEGANSRSIDKNLNPQRDQVGASS